MSERPHPSQLQEVNRFGTKVRTFASRHWFKVFPGSTAAIVTFTQVLAVRPVAAIEGAIGVGLMLIPDRVKASQRKQAKKDAEEVLGSKSTKRFTAASVNEGATLLEANLGITFPEGQRPQQVDLHGKNRLFAIPSQRTFALSREPGVIYDNEFNTVFDKNGDFEDVLDANMQAYMDTTNPAFVQIKQEYKRASIRLAEGKASPHFDVEKFAVYSIFRLGFAGLMSSHAFEGELIDFDNSWFSREEEQTLQSKSFKAMSAYITLLKNKFHNKPKLFHLRPNEEFSEDVGFLSLTFTSQVINFLIENGVSQSQAIHRVVKNPPSTLAELAYPMVYLHNNQEVLLGEEE